MSLTVLLVDDSDDKIIMLRRELIACGILVDNIYTAKDAVGARRLLSEKNFDLLLLDLVLPARAGVLESAETGLELLRQMVEDHDIPAPRNIVGITADDAALRVCESVFRSLTTQILYVDPSSVEWKYSLKKLIGRIQNSSVQHFDVDVCFVTALRHPELSQILNLAYDWTGEESLGNGILVRRGKRIIGGVERRFICAHSHQMGLVSATLTTRLLIELFKPKLLLMTGICGGIANKPALGDIVVAEKSWDWQCGKWLHDGSFEIAPDQKDGSSELIAFALGSSDQLSKDHCAFVGARPPNPPSLHIGPMVSGSAVVADPSMHTKFTIQHRKSIGIDMECYGVYFAASMSPEPAPKVLCIKAVSDLANRDKSDNIQDYCSYISARLAFDIVERYFSQSR